MPSTLRQSVNRRYLVDQRGKPVLLIGDAPQALLVNLTLQEADAYFADRAKFGFNACWVNLLCADYPGGRRDAKTFDGVAPFLKPDDFSSPNETYFARADAMIRAAAHHGITVLLDPAETGSFLRVMRLNGVDGCRAFGRFLGRRYRGFPNIVWFNGNDFQTWRNPADDALAIAVAKGIADEDTRHLQTVELDYDRSSSADDPNWVPLLGINGAYTYFPTYQEVQRDYIRTPKLPVLMIESDYEFENGADLARLRKEMYWSLLSGAGYIYGNGYIWPFKQGWREHLDTPGASQVQIGAALFRKLPWWNLVPDIGHEILIGGFGTFSADFGPAHAATSKSDYATAAATPDGRLAVIYLPTPRKLTVDLARFRSSVSASWFDPATGVESRVQGSPFPNRGTRDFVPPDGTSSDRLLILRSR